MDQKIFLGLFFEIRADTSASSAGSKAKDSADGLWRKSLKDFFPSYFLSLSIESAIVEK